MKKQVQDFAKEVVRPNGIVTERTENINGTTCEMVFNKYLGIERKGNVVESLISPDQLESLGISLQYAAQDPTAKIFVVGRVSEHKKPADGYNQVHKSNTVDGFNPVYLSKEAIARYAKNPQQLLKFSPETLLKANVKEKPKTK